MDGLLTPSYNIQDSISIQSFLDADLTGGISQNPDRSPARLLHQSRVTVDALVFYSNQHGQVTEPETPRAQQANFISWPCTAWPGLVSSYGVRLGNTTGHTVGWPGPEQATESSRRPTGFIA